MANRSNAQRVGGTPRGRLPSDGAWGFFALACTLTWLCALPTASAWIAHRTPAPYAVAGAGLSAFGPLLAALAMAGPRGQLDQVFGHWRTSPTWVVLGLAAPVAIHAAATLLFVAIGGHPDHWFHPPLNAEAVAALVVFPIGEEFGWRGFAQPRLARRYGLVTGSLLVGVGWGVWHLMYCVTPQAAGFDAREFLMILSELPLYALLSAWLFERSRRSMAVAIAFHAGAHLDHIEPAARADFRLHGLHVLVLVVLSLFAARALAARTPRLSPDSRHFP